MAWNVLELAGLALVVAFFALIWWPSALLVGGVLLVVVAWVGETRSKPVKVEEEPE